MTRTQVLREIRTDEVRGSLWRVAGAATARPARRTSLGGRPVEETPWERGHLARGGLGSRPGGPPAGGMPALPGPPSP